MAGVSSFQRLQGIDWHGGDHRPLCHSALQTHRSYPRETPEANRLQSLGRENHKVVELSFLAARVNLSKKDFAGVRTKLTRNLFEDLPRAEQEEWEKKTTEHHKIALEQWGLRLRSPPSVDPIDRQQYVCYPLMISTY